MTYLIAGWAATGISGRTVRCADNELANFDPPSGQTCGEYLSRYLQAGAPGQLYNPDATSQCRYCPLTSADQFLAGSNIYESEKWRNFGIGFAYIFFNVSSYLRTLQRYGLLLTTYAADLCLHLPVLSLPRAAGQHHQLSQRSRTRHGSHLQ